MTTYYVQHRTYSSQHQWTYNGIFAVRTPGPLPNWAVGPLMASLLIRAQTRMRKEADPTSLFWGTWELTTDGKLLPPPKDPVAERIRVLVARGFSRTTAERMAKNPRVVEHLEQQIANI